MNFLYWILIISLTTIVPTKEILNLSNGTPSNTPTTSDKLTSTTHSSLEKAPGWEERTELPDDYPRPPKSTQSLFFIQRNLNTNTIVYDVDLEEGKIKSNHPIDVYWLRYGDDPIRYEITWLQSILAYGYSSKKIEEGYRIRLKAHKERYLQLRQVDGNWKAVLKINNVDCYLQNIYVYANEASIFPDVKYADLYGINLVTGEQVVERILNK